ncbi:MAG: hypothetical protein Q9N34_08615 [Aquificota bacterium]|nr:hypothetical protein [Aquificota bacterium]
MEKVQETRIRVLVMEISSKKMEIRNKKGGFCSAMWWRHMREFLPAVIFVFSLGLILHCSGSPDEKGEGGGGKGDTAGE